MGCKNVFFFSLWLQDMASKLWNGLQATKWCAKTLCKAKENCKNANRASQPCIYRREPSHWDHIHQASHSIFNLPTPSQPIAPTESSSRGDYATQGDYQSRGQCPDPTHSEGHHISTGPFYYLIISLFFVFTYYISIHNFMFWCLIFWDWMYFWWCIIYRHHFCLNLAFFYFLYSLFFCNMWFLLYDSDSMSLRRYHFLPIFQSLLSH